MHHLRNQFLSFILIIFCCASCQVSQRKQTKALKFHPGHYVAVGPFFNLSKVKHLNTRGLKGINKRFFWRTLEPEKNEYNFSYIEQDLAYCAKHNKQLIIFLCDRAFWKKGALPAYLKKYEWKNDGGGFSPIRWNPEFVQCLLALGKALARQFDNHPNFEGIAIQETALDIPNRILLKYDYTPQKYQEALRSILVGLSTSFSRSQVFWYQNGIQGSNKLIRQIADSIAYRENIVMGGPDVLPYRKWLRHTYKIYGDYKAKMSLFCSAQDDSYHHHKNDIRMSEKRPVHPEGYLTMDDIFLYARDHLHVKYLFWNHYYEEVVKGGRSFDDAIKVVRKYPEFNN